MRYNRLHHAHNRSDNWTNICSRDMGKILELGPKRGMVCNNMVVICNSVTRANKSGLARKKSSHYVYYWILRAFIHVPGCQFPVKGTSWRVYEVLNNCNRRKSGVYMQVFQTHFSNF